MKPTALVEGFETRVREQPLEDHLSAHPDRLTKLSDDCRKSLFFWEFGPFSGGFSTEPCPHRGDRNSHPYESPIETSGLPPARTEAIKTAAHAAAPLKQAHRHSMLALSALKPVRPPVFAASLQSRHACGPHRGH